MTTDHTPDTLANLLDEVLNHAEAAASNTPHTGPLHGIPTGFTDLDNLTAGIHPGSLTVIASRPAMGRTTLLSDICRTNAIREHLPTAVYTLEEGRARFATRILSAEAHVARDRIQFGRLTDDDRIRLAKRTPAANTAPLYVKAPPAITMEDLATEAATLVEEHNVRLIAVDGIQDVKPEKTSDLREREVGDVARGLKTLARRLNVPVVATSHLNRSPEQRIDKRPKLDDLRESGAITFAADTIILLHREDYYDPESPRAGEADFIVAKHRYGPRATVTVAFQGHYGRFVDFAY